jgi:probable HAF family extracellular repeat protein
MQLTKLLLAAVFLLPPGILAAAEVPPTPLPKYVDSSGASLDGFPFFIGGNGGISGTVNGVWPVPLLYWSPSGETMVADVANSNWCWPYAMNDSGQIAGECSMDAGHYWDFAVQAIFWEPGNPVVFPVPQDGSYRNSNPTAINNNGEMIGLAEVVGPNGVAGWNSFYWSKEKGFRNLADSVPGGYLADLNDLGMSVGIRSYRTTGGSWVTVPFIWSEAEGLRDLSVPLGYGSPYARFINNRGQVVGTAISSADRKTVGVFWDIDGTAQVIPSQGGYNFQLLGLNESGQVAGYLDVPTSAGNFVFHPFLWSRQDGFKDLGLSDPSTNGCTVDALNNLGEVVGTCWFDNFSGRRAFYWDGTAMTPLGTLGEAYPWTAPIGLNDSGVIVGVVSGQASIGVTWQAPNHSLGPETPPVVETNGFESLRQRIIELHASGAIPKSLKKSLLTLLSASERKFAGGKCQAAKNNLTAFSNVVKGAQKSQKISAANGQDLLQRVTALESTPCTRPVPRSAAGNKGK